MNGLRVDGFSSKATASTPHNHLAYNKGFEVESSVIGKVSAKAYIFCLARRAKGRGKHTGGISRISIGMRVWIFCTCTICKALGVSRYHVALQW